MTQVQTQHLALLTLTPLSHGSRPGICSPCWSNEDKSSKGFFEDHPNSTPDPSPALLLHERAGLCYPIKQHNQDISVINWMQTSRKITQGKTAFSTSHSSTSLLPHGMVTFKQMSYFSSVLNHCTRQDLEMDVLHSSCWDKSSISDFRLEQGLI